ncbi:MAG: alpha/beta fold hydrolase [Pseudonocardia sp.]|nr:alpha/beta fold hydrolase [Pseudonocardia sp.]
MANRTPVVFIHGLWLHASSWGPWIELFRETGYEPMAPGWPGDPETVQEARANPERIAGHGIDDVVAHVAGLVGGLDTKPILIGHSFTPFPGPSPAPRRSSTGTPGPSPTWRSSRTAATP